MKDQNDVLLRNAGTCLVDGESISKVYWIQSLLHHGTHRSSF